MPGLGRAALVITLGLIVYALAAGSYAALTGRRRLLASARNAIYASFGSTLVATAVLLAAFASRDFGFELVARSTSRALPDSYALTAFWATQEGSLLFWLLVLTGVSSAALALNRRLVEEVLPWATPVLAAIAVFFAFMLVAVSSPFETQLASADGRGMTPSLQNPYMAAHPPLLYLGYVGLSIPFAFGMAALLSRRVDERWIVATRQWTLGAWAFLGLGILVGSKWAYEEVGWGGWYAWDPVENAALMPWLAATAYLHSVMIQEKKDMLRVWNMILVALSFALALFGTFLVRSGVLNSIHSFAQSPIGAWFLGALAVAVVASTVLIVTRLPMLRSRSKMESFVSREAAFLYNNLFLVALCLTVLWGVIYPLVSEAIRGVASTVGAPYYNFFAIAFGVPLVFLMAIGPLVAWRRGSLRSIGASLAWPAGIATVCAIVLLALGAGSNSLGVVGYSFAAFVLASITLEFVRGTRARKALGDSTWPGAFTTLIGRNRRRYGGYIVHAAIALLLIGAVGVGAYGAASTRKLAAGDSMRIEEYTLTFLGTTQQRVANRVELRAQLEVTRDGKPLGRLAAGKNRYPTEQLTSNEVAIRSDWLRAEDLFVIGDRFNADGTVWLKVIVNPLVNLIWLSGFVFLLGSLVTLWPDAREQLRLARRFGLAGASGR